MKIRYTVAGEYQENCYLIYGEDSQTCVIVDPGDDAYRIKEMIRQSERTPELILVTHGHFDHLASAAELSKAYGIRIVFPAKEVAYLKDKRYSLMRETAAILCEFTEALSDKSELLLNGASVEGGGLTFKAVEVPGHTDHSMCYLVKENDEQCVFSGDTLFAGSIGRTDLYAGDPKDLIVNLKNTLMKLEDTTLVLPGHGPLTKIEREKQWNPYVGETNE